MSPWVISIMAGMAGGLIAAMVFRTGPAGRDGKDGVMGPCGPTGMAGRDGVEWKGQIVVPTPAKKKARRK